MEYNKAVAEFKTLISSVKPTDLEQFLICTKDIINGNILKLQNLEKH